MVAKAVYFLDGKPRLSQSKSLQESPIWVNWHILSNTVVQKKSLFKYSYTCIYISFNEKTQREISDEEGFHFPWCQRLRGEDWETSTRDGWSPEPGKTRVS